MNREITETRIVKEEVCENTGQVITHVWNVCKHCGAKVYDLENECGCHREVS